MLAEEAGDLRGLLVAPDEARRSRGQIVAVEVSGDERQLVIQDGALELSQLLTRLQAKPHHQPISRLSIRVESICLPIAPVEREHEVSSQALAEWLF